MPDFNKFNDCEILKLLSEGSKESEYAFNTLYFRYTTQLYGYCVYQSANKEEAEELLQDTWLKFNDSVKAGKNIQNIAAFLFTIAKNLSIDRYRTNKAKKNIDMTFLDKDFLEEIIDPVNFQVDYEKEELSNQIRLAIEYLDDIYKETLTLYWFGNFTLEEIAEILGDSVTVQCIRTRLDRAFKQIAKVLEPYFEENREIK
ncbi:MAG: RNA polymerase sigma factor [FCB group bacterium]|jgi:RNA polymerase sigma-70 factor (ECF subfamily)